MSKAIIISHAGKGQYVVDVVYDSAYIQHLIDKLNTDYSRLQFNDLIKTQDALDAEQAKVDAAADAVDIAIIDYNTNPTEENLKLVQKLTFDGIAAGENFELAKLQHDFVTTRMDALRRQIMLLRGFLTEKRRDILWCADLADGKFDRRMLPAGAEIGVLEVNGWERLGQVLRPSYPWDWQYQPARDGRLMNVAGMTAPEVFWNVGVLPAWERWRHRYRTGTIIGGDPLVGWQVRLDNLKSEEQQIPVNEINDDRLLTGVHAVYMNCDDEAFGQGDHVVLDVQISGPAVGFITAATIIGFVDHPKPCLTAGFGYYASSSSGAEWQRITDATGSWVMHHPYTADITVDNLSVVLSSWIGTDADEGRFAIQFARLTSSHKGIFLEGTHITDVPSDHAWVILGAALTKNKKYLYVALTYSGQGTHITVKRAKLDITFTVTAWETQDIDLGTYASNIGGTFHFNASCTQALSMWSYTHGFHRSPQSAPAAGTTWWVRSPPVTYDSTWAEKIELSIPDPESAALDVTFTNHGRQGALLYKWTHRRDLTYSDPIKDNSFVYPDGGHDYCWSAVDHLTEDREFSGSYQIAVGFVEDKEIDYFVKFTGTYSEITHEEDSKPETTYSNNITYVASFTIEVDALSVEILANHGTSSTVYHRVSPNDPTETVEGTTDAKNSRFNIYDTDDEFFSVEFDHCTGSFSSQYPGTYSGDTTHHYQGNLYAGGLLLDHAEETPFGTTDSGTTPFPGVDTLFVCRTDIKDADLPAVDAVIRANEVHGGSSEDGFFDVTGVAGILQGLSSPSVLGGEAGIPTHRYADTYGARSGNGRYCVSWSTTRTPGNVQEFGSFLTGGSLDALDGLATAAAYYSIHAL